MKKYAYLIASLPELERFCAPPMKSQEFLALLIDQLEPRHSAQLHIQALLNQAHAQRTGDKQERAAEHTPENGAAYHASDDTIANATQEAPILTLWHEYDGGFRGELARLRAIAIGIDEKVHWGYVDSALHLEELHRIFALENHLEAEHNLHSMRWELLTDLSDQYRNDLFDLYIYYIKLTLLERMEQMHARYADTNLKNIHDAIYHEMITKINMVVVQ